MEEKGTKVQASGSALPVICLPMNKSLPYFRSQFPHLEDDRVNKTLQGRSL